MTDAPANGLLRLMAWLSPAFPVGGFSYSHGLESAAAGIHPAAREVAPTPDPSKPAENDCPPVDLVSDATGLQDWLAALLRFGSAWNDAVLFAEAWRRQSSGGDLAELAELGAALAGSRERHMETTLQGAGFLSALRHGWPSPVLQLPETCPYCIAVGAAAAAHGIALEPALSAWLQAFVANLGQAAIRLGITGQAGAVAVVAALESVIAETSGRAVLSSLDDLGSATVLAEVVSMRHETHYSRLFRT